MTKLEICAIRDLEVQCKGSIIDFGTGASWQHTASLLAEFASFIQNKHNTLDAKKSVMFLYGSGLFATIFPSTSVMVAFFQLAQHH